MDALPYYCTELTQVIAYSFLRLTRRAFCALQLIVLLIDLSVELVNFSGERERERERDQKINRKHRGSSPVRVFISG